LRRAERAAFLTQARYQAGEVGAGQADGVTTNTELNAIAAAIMGLRNPGAASLQTAIN
jgi:hypothetical protein